MQELIIENAQKDAHFKKIKDLIESTDVSNQLLALELIKGLNLILNFEEELLILSKISSDKVVRADCRQILGKYGNPAYQNLYKNIIFFEGLGTHLRESEIRKKMQNIVKSVDWDQIYHLCMVFYERFGRGLSFLLHFPLFNVYRKEAILKMTQDGVFDYHSLLGYSDRRNVTHDSRFVYPYPGGQSIKFPIDHPQAESIRVLQLHNCKLDKLPVQIKVFPNVEEIDLSSNPLKSLPNSLAQLKKLKRLDLSYNHLKEFPKVLLKLKDLEFLDLRFNRFRYKSMAEGEIQSLENFDESLFYKNNPGCKLLLNKIASTQVQDA